MQSRRHSIAEAVANTATGFVISVVVSYFIFSHAKTSGVSTPESWAILTTSVFTVISVVRNYIVRRVFNYLHARG